MGTVTEHGKLFIGGFKQSGIGREFGPEGLRAYLETKTMHLPNGYTPEGF
jgi:acyl-CoA reductase-like NAD-dependent aldehyde dehydrogenase